MSSTFERAHDFTLSASEINFGTTNYYGDGRGSKAAALERLRENIAAGAMHNSDERCDAPKCHPETRVAVQEEVVGWILDEAHKGEGASILWLTGPAGGGKTAIMGSIADICHQKGLLACGFFFSSFAGAASRRSKRCLVATMAYQLLQHDALRDVGERILSSVERNPAIFEQQLEVQLDQLVLRPLRECRRDPDGLPWPKVIVIDGLDECDAVQYIDIVQSPHVTPRTKEADQTEILYMLLEAANDPSFPFRIIVASRPEPAIQAFFNKDIASSTTRKIFLDAKYNPNADMLLFLDAKLSDIRRQYHLPHLWPSENLKQTLIDNASGQFIYVATAMRFIGGSSALPQELFSTVLHLPVMNVSSNPFAPLDALYSHIISSSSNPLLTVRWLCIIFVLFPALVNIHTATEYVSAWFSQLFMQSSPGEATYVLGGLHSLISIPPTEDHTSPYSLFHKSLTDFLTDGSRCGDLYVDGDAVGELYTHRYLEIWKNKGPSTTLNAIERTAFLHQYFKLSFAFPPKHNFDLYDVAWWVCCHDDLCIKDSMNRLRHVNMIQRLFLGVHSSCMWYRRCRPVCKYCRESMLKELQELGWKTPSWLQLLCHRFTRFPSYKTYKSDIKSPPPFFDTTRNLDPRRIGRGLVS